MRPSNFSSKIASLLLKDSKSPTTAEAPARWSQLGVSHPAAVVIPSSEKEIISVLRLAATKKLQVIPMAGAHSPFVPISERSLLLDMRNFRHVSVTPGSVTFGGGSTAGDVIKACATEQCYTCKLALGCQDSSR
jgi:FAD/FMN-containing dehydrogenase